MSGLLLESCEPGSSTTGGLAVTEFERPDAAAVVEKRELYQALKGRLYAPKVKASSIPPSLNSFKVKPAPIAADRVTPPSPAAPEGDDRKLTTSRFTHAQRRYLRRFAFDEEVTLQDCGDRRTISTRLSKAGPILPHRIARTSRGA